MAVVGIDLGTTNSLIAVYENDEVRLIANRLGDYLTASVVSIMDYHLMVGKSAKERQVTNPMDSVSAFKRFMGTEKKYNLNKHELGAIELSSLILKSLIEDAESDLGEKITEAVISVPAYFNDMQRNATIEAARIAGIKVNRLINEPTAAAVAYHMHDQNDEVVLAIVDLGGGTFDVSILDIFDSIVEVRAVSGDNYLGGEDFDEAIMKYLAKKMKLDLDEIGNEFRSKLKYTAEKAKISLSSQKRVIVKLSHSDQEYSCEMTSDELEIVIDPLLQRLREPLKKAVKDSNFTFSEIDEVILVGGSTRMPIIKKFIARLFGKLPLSHLNPDEVVVKGAAITAAMVDRHVSFEDTVLTDVCPYTLGTTVLRENRNGDYVEVYDPIIERNQTVPLSKSMVYSNAGDNQTKIGVDVYQGDSFKVDNNLKLGRLELAIPPGPANTIRIEVRFTYDINGILEVEVYVPKTGLKETAVLMNTSNLSDQEIKLQLKNIEHLKVHPRENEENIYLLQKAERMYEMNRGKEREQISNEILRFEADLDKQDRDISKRALKRMKEFLEYLEVSN